MRTLVHCVSRSTAGHNLGSFTREANLTPASKYLGNNYISTRVYTRENVFGLVLPTLVCKMTKQEKRSGK